MYFHVSCCCRRHRHVVSIGLRCHCSSNSHWMKHVAMRIKHSCGSQRVAGARDLGNGACVFILTWGKGVPSMLLFMGDSGGHWVLKLVHWIRGVGSGG